MLANGGGVVECTSIVIGNVYLTQWGRVACEAPNNRNYCLFAPAGEGIQQRIPPRT